MKRFVFPGAVELSILATMAILCAAVLATARQSAILVVLVFPLALTGMLMGAWRNGKLAETPKPVAEAEPVEADEPAA